MKTIDKRTPAQRRTHCNIIAATIEPQRYAGLATIQDNAGTVYAWAKQTFPEGSRVRMCGPCYRPKGSGILSIYPVGNETLIFYVWRGEVLAVWPGIVDGPNGELQCYAHVGQHCYIDIRCLNEETCKIAEPGEYADLLQELRKIGYQPYVLNELLTFKNS